jgi:tRNA U34 5-methylaminomethyl-2-thiouridine-forming methyltransferase MnmC
MGFGTGLNAILTLIAAHRQNIRCTYHAVEAYPLEQELLSQLNYQGLIDPPYHAAYTAMHEAEWNKEVIITPYFHLKKIHGRLETFEPETCFDVVYFDAFAPDKQPVLWTAEIFRNIFDHMNSGAVLVTYSAKGEVRRTLQEVGFTVEKLPGPPGKKHMVRATKK